MQAVDSVQALAGCDLVIEAIVEDLEVKRQLFRELEAAVCRIGDARHQYLVAVGHRDRRRADAAGADGRLPLLQPGPADEGGRGRGRLQDRARGLHAVGRLCARRWATARSRRKDTPGFIVNHAGRGYGTEALRIAGEGVADFATIDRILKDQAGFRLGPFELLDLTGLDVSHPVMESIYRQYYEEPRYRPSADRRAAAGRGRPGTQDGRRLLPLCRRRRSRAAAEPPAPKVDALPPVWVSPRAARRPELLRLVHALGAQLESGAAPSSAALILVAPLGFDVTTVAAVERPRRHPHRRHRPDGGRRRHQAPRAGHQSGDPARHARRRPCAVRARRQGRQRDPRQRRLRHPARGRRPSSTSPPTCASRASARRPISTLAVRLGLGYPQGPLAMGDLYGPTNMLEVLFNLQTVYGDPRYRPSPWLRRRGALGLSLTHPRRMRTSTAMTAELKSTSEGRTMVLTLSNPSHAQRTGPRDVRRRHRGAERRREQPARSAAS